MLFQRQTAAFPKESLGYTQGKHMLFPRGATSRQNPSEILLSELRNPKSDDVRRELHDRNNSPTCHPRRPHVETSTRHLTDLEYFNRPETFRNQVSHVSPHQTSTEKRNELTDFQRELKNRPKIIRICSAASGRFVLGCI